MNLQIFSSRTLGYNLLVFNALEYAKKFFAMGAKQQMRNNMDNMSDAHEIKKQLRCSISGCFDKDNLCCKACDIKNCRYKCNNLHKKVCENQFV
jgi:hypothetical protein